MNPDLPIRDVIFPIVKVEPEESGLRYRSVVGTGFLIGSRGFALTAAHVVEQAFAEEAVSVAAFIIDGQWTSSEILLSEKHATEDVAILKLRLVPGPSCLRISSAAESASRDYDCWGYPIDVAELAAKYEEDQLERPDLIYTRGYVRRRYSWKLPTSIYRGSSFYELSELAGSGCSGAPIVTRASVGKAMWDVFGVYIGEASAGFAAAYAVRSDSFWDWSPSVVGSTLKDESLTV